MLYTEGLEIGYRWHDAAEVAPLFSFGHGLSYTTFSLTNLTVTPRPGRTVAVSFTIRNTGSLAGAEVPQLYVGFPVAARTPPRQLKAFSKIFLQPGASERVFFTLDEMRDLSIWNVAAGRWHTVPGQYRFEVATGSRSIELQKTIEIVQ